MRVIASDESRTRRLTATKLHGTSPRGEQSSTEAVAEVQTDSRKGSRWVRNRNNEGQCDRFVKAEKSEEWMARSPVWPDDVIASEMASAPSANELAWFYMGSRLGHAEAFPKRQATQCWVTYERELLITKDIDCFTKTYIDCNGLYLKHALIAYLHCNWFPHTNCKCFDANISLIDVKKLDRPLMCLLTTRHEWRKIRQFNFYSHFIKLLFKYIISIGYTKKRRKEKKTIIRHVKWW